MNRREELQDRYEDALFALLMDEMAAAEGKKALEENERLKSDPGAAVPEVLDRRCRKTIRRQFTRMRLRTVGRYTGRALGKLAMVVGVVSTLLICAFAASETVRSSVLNLVVEAFPDSTSFYFDGAQPQSGLPRITAGWTPEGLALVDQGQGDFETWKVYQGNENVTLQIAYLIGDGSTLNVDTEEVGSSEQMDINGREATVYQKGGSIQIVLCIPERTSFLIISGEGIGREDMIRTAEHVEVEY